MLNKLMIAFCIISWVVIIPYMLSDIEQSLDHSEQLLQQIKSYGEQINVQRDF